MAEIDPELRDKIIETHTIVGRMDAEFKEHKTTVHARFKEAKLVAEKHETRLDAHDTFRTKMMTYGSIIVVVGAFASNFISDGIRKIMGF